MSPSKICPQCGGTFGPEERFCPKDGSALRPEGATDGLIGQVIADRYQILQRLGEGGMGRVYLAEHVRMGRKSAVKVMSPDLALSADAISRFNREASNASRINHPNVAQIYDFGETKDGVLYLAMEFVEGETLSAIIQREGALPPARAAQLTKQVADALGAAHHMGIVHRDLKPDNIMVARHHDGSDWVKVVDFGIAKTIQGSGERGAGGSQTVTTAGVSIGTPEYMSPEQLAGDRLDNRTDLYSLGLVLFNMLTGDLPYPRLTSRDTLVKRLTSRPQTLSEVVPNRSWPAALQAALDRALAPDVADRYESVTDFGRDVVAATANLGSSDRTVPVASIERPVSPAIAATTAQPASPVPVTRPSAQVRQSAPATTASAPVRRSTLVAAAVLLVAGGGAFFALRGGKSGQPAAAAKADSAGAPAQTQAAAPAPTPSSQAGDSAAGSKSNGSAPIVSAKSSSKQVAVDSAASKPGAEKSAEKTAAVAPATTLAKPATRAAEPPVDSVPTITVPAETTSAGRTKRMAQFQHAWIGATGDSANGKGGPPATDEDRIRLLAGDIQGHLARANQFIKQGDVPKARGEYREAAPVVTMLRKMYAGTPSEQRVEQMVRQGGMQVMSSCRTAFADSSLHAKMPATFHCEGLIPIGMRPGGRGRGNSGVPFRDR